MECPECGTPSSDEDLFCGECGAILATPLADEPAEPPPLDLPLEPFAPVSASSAPSYAPAVRDSRARAAFILGLVSIASVALICLPLSSFLGCVGPIAGIIAIVLGTRVKRDIETRGGLQEDWKRAHQGMILGIVGTAIYSVLLVIGILLGIGVSLMGEL